MRKSLIEIQEIEQYHLGQMDKENTQQFETQLLLEPALKEKVDLQQKIYAIIRFLSRQVLRKEIIHIQDQLFKHPDNKVFQEKIKAIFS